MGPLWLHDSTLILYPSKLPHKTHESLESPLLRYWCPQSFYFKGKFISLVITGSCMTRQGFRRYYPVPNPVTTSWCRNRLFREVSWGTRSSSGYFRSSDLGSKSRWIQTTSQSSPFYRKPPVTDGTTLGRIDLNLTPILR